MEFKFTLIMFILAQGGGEVYMYADYVYLGSGMFHSKFKYLLHDINVDTNYRYRHAS